MINKIRTTTLLILPVVFLSLVSIANAFQQQSLPRSYGPLYLGMPLEEFTNIFPGADPGRCVHCAEGEIEAAVCVTEETGRSNLCVNANPAIFKDAQIDHQPKAMQAREITCIFYKGVLYDILLTNIKSKIAAVKQNYSKAFGKQTGYNRWNTGLSQLRWKNTSTILSVTYDTKIEAQKDANDFIEIRYTDYKFQKQVPKRKRLRGK